MSKALSADGVELKVGMPVWHRSKQHAPSSSSEVIKVRDSAFAKKVRVETETDCDLCEHFYATEKAFLEFRKQEEARSLRFVANSMTCIIGRQRDVQSRLAALAQEQSND